MKEIWVKADPWDRGLVIAALEAGADAVMVGRGRVESVRALGRIQTVAEDGDLQWGRDVVCLDVHASGDEERVIQESRERRVIIRTADWRIIPLENLVARTGNIMVEAGDEDEAEAALGVLEKGVDGLVLTNRNPARIRQLLGLLRSPREGLELSVFRVTRVSPLGLGDRVCVDTCTLMEPGLGGLVGSSSRGLFLMHAESLENPYVSPRPFRINAGAVHAYILDTNGRTRYLSELRAGDSIAGVNTAGKVFPLWVGRVKIERRPMILVEAEGAEGAFTTVCQNAETIRMVRHGSGEAVSVVSLSPGDEIFGRAEQGGRHFGHRIRETILER
ncbi:MAG: 3-dehydroquinate synthase II [Deltaproteobacteria bacterium]|nr:3-dehydroquinate synthase II [Deltaproteobacteria bacterium]